MPTKPVAELSDDTLRGYCRTLLSPNGMCQDEAMKVMAAAMCDIALSMRVLTRQMTIR